MPWYFWLLAVLWTVPILWVAFAVAKFAWWDERKARRAMASQERRAEALIVHDAAAGSEPRPFAEGSFECQRFNPRVHGRPDHWRT